MGNICRYCNVYNDDAVEHSYECAVQKMARRVRIVGYVLVTTIVSGVVAIFISGVRTP